MNPSGHRATARCLRRLLVYCLPALCFVQSVQAGPPFLTGKIEDTDAQIVEIPRLPGAWQRQVEWMAPEGESVEPGDLLVRLDPGTLIEREEKQRTDLEALRLEAKRKQAERDIALFDADTEVIRAESAVRLAAIDAAVPVTATNRLEHERAQLVFATATQALARTNTELAARREEDSGAGEVMRQRLEKADYEWQRLRAALASTEIRAERGGIMIYAEHPYTGKKIFPGETHETRTTLARVANPAQLQFRFWVHEADITILEPGVQLLVRADALPGLAVPAIINWSSKQAGARDEWSQGGYFEVTAQPENGSMAGGEFMPGMSVMAAVAGPVPGP